MRKFVLGLDEGTTSLRAVLFDVDKKQIVAAKRKTFAQMYPHSGWVEQDADEIFKKILSASRSVLKEMCVKEGELLALAITNQRETAVAWDRRTGKPICNAIVWQCRRTSSMIESLSDKAKQTIQERSGLIANPYFSASKFKWILDNVKEAKSLAKSGNLCFGTIDTYLAFMLTGTFVTDTTNASRTMLMNLKTLNWDDELLSIFQIPKECLPKILPSDSNFGNVKTLLNAPLLAMIGDQQSSMIGQGAIDLGDTKVTFGTGGFILTNISEECAKSQDKLLVTVGRTLSGKTEYAIEGSIFSACSAIDYLGRLGFFKNVSETAEMAQSVKDNGGVYLVPAFTGLGAPYWKNEGRASISGLSFGCTREHIVRSCLESLAYNTKAIVDELRKNGQNLKRISVDGGGSKNQFVMQFLADMLGQSVVRSKESESTVMGAIYVALLNLKLISRKDIKAMTKSEDIFKNSMNEKTRNQLYEGWQKAVEKV